MKTIWKYTLEVVEDQVVMMPAKARVLTVAAQEGKLCLWAMVDPLMTLERRRFRILGTGNPIEPPLRGETYLGTVQLGMFVWHVWEVCL